MQRDLASHDLWTDSLARSRARREREAASGSAKSFDLPGRGLSVAALVAVGGSVAAVTGAAVGDEESGARASGSSVRPPAIAKAPEAGRQRSGQRASGRARASFVAPTRSSSTGGATSAPSPPPGTALAGAPAVAAADATNADAQSDGERRAREKAVTAASAAVPSGPGQAPARSAGRRGGVVALQRALGVTADGAFGPATERALKRWQRRHGLTADGVAGPATRRALGLGSGPVLEREGTRRSGSRTHRSGKTARGGGVAALQRALGIAADGVFGPGTERALKAWQGAHGLAADGVAGSATRRALGLGPGPLLRRRRASGGDGGGDRSSLVARVVAAANAIADKPYRYGGGHGSFNDSGYDCSGSVSYALHGAGLLSSPLDSSGFMSYGEPGPGKHVTIYAHPGHVYMVIDGRRFDTSARWETGSRWTSTQRSSSGYTVRHPRGL